MVNSETIGPYLKSRKKWIRPQAIIFSNNSNGIIDGVPQIDGVEREDFLILSDHNRSDIGFSANRIENRKRMVNGHMRSYHIADKMNISFSYSLLPSRSFGGDPQFNTNGVSNNSELIEYTVDGGAGGAELLEWYSSNPGSFYMFVSYDKPQSFSSQDRYENLDKYSDVLEVFISDFSYNVIKRGNVTDYSGQEPIVKDRDLWDISISLEEV
jgi:hypothetical protein